MTLGMWALVFAVAAQSLGEVAERERQRRQRNAEAGVEAVSFTSQGGPVVPVNSEAAEPPESDEGGEPASPMDAERARGAVLEPRLAEISSAADRVDELYRRYVNACYGRYAIGATPPGIGFPAAPPTAHVQTGRAWFLVLETPSPFTTPVPTGPGGSFLLVETPQCQSLREALLAAAAGVKRAMRELLELARRERILPGVVRELREKYRLEWSGWER